MAENQDGAEKKHAATDKKRTEASEKGQIAKSQDLSALGVLAAAGFCLIAAGSSVGTPMLQMSTDLWKFEASRTLDIDGVAELGAIAIMGTGQALVVPLAGALVGALAIGFAQSKGQLAPKALEPKLEKLNPLTGFKNAYMSWTPLVELGKGLGKFGLVGATVTWGIWDRLDELPGLAALDVRAFMAELVELSGTILLLSLPAIMLIAAADYGYSAWKTGEDLKMTDEEVKQQNKEQEGDPKWKGHRRARARQIAMGTMIQALAEADVIVTNPTHFAVALRYKRDRDAAPIVVAKGVDHMALLIRQKGKELDIPRIENRPLARALHARVEVGHPVPEDLYGPVAKVLAVIFRRRAKRRGPRIGMG